MGRTRGKSQRVQTAPTSTRERPGTSIVRETAELLYAAYRGHLAKNGRDPVKSRRKPWHEIAAVERAAWRNAAEILRLLTSNGMRLTIPTPDDDTLMITGRQGNLFATYAVSRSAFLAGGKRAIIKALKEIDDDIQSRMPEGEQEGTGQEEEQGTQGESNPPVEKAS